MKTHVFHQPYVLASGILGAAVLFAVALVLATSGFSGLVHADIATTTVTVGNAAPTIDAVTLNAGNNITLVEDDGSNNGFVYASTTITITDTNGCSSISSVSAKLYRDTLTTNGTNCTADDNNCYAEFNACTATTTGNTCTGGADTTVQYDCAFKVWYLADPTAAGQAFASSIWAVSATTSDSSFATTTATNTGETIEVNGLLANTVTATIPYGTVGAGADTGATNDTTTVTNTGNTPLDTELSGDVMCTDYAGARTCPNGGIAPSNQEYALAGFTWGSGTDLVATTAPATVETVLAKPTATTTAVTDDVLWGIGVPAGQGPGDYTGENTFTAVAD